MKYIFFILGCGLFFFGCVRILKAETYNTMHIDCGSLHGSGNVGIWFNDEYYLIPIKCE